MRYRDNDTWPSCDGCDRPLPNAPDARGVVADDATLGRLGWMVVLTRHGHARHLCTSCAERVGVEDEESNGN